MTETRKKLSIGMAAAVCLFLVYGAATHPEAIVSAHIHSVGPEPPTPQPEFGWQASRGVEFVLPPGEGQAWGPMTVWSNGQLRYDVKATTPVNLGVSDNDWYESNHDAAWAGFEILSANLEDGANSAMPIFCLAQKNLHSQQTCTLSKTMGKARIFVRDARNPDNTPLAAAAALAGIKEPLKRQTAENRVTLTFYAWKCVRWCDGVKP